MEYKKNELDAIIDWVQVTFKELDCTGVMESILQFDKDLMTYEGWGRFRYTGKWKFSGIEILTPPVNYPEMGYHLYMTGSACRSFEIYLRAQKRTWFDFFKECIMHNGFFTRLDIAIDDRKPYFSIREAGRKLEVRECVSKLRNWTFIDGGQPQAKRPDAL